ncbi:hypothetical protein Tco_0928332 [Tanacetum coccineum]
MDLYHSRLTLDDLNDLIIKYKIPHDLHPWLPSEEFVMSELPDDAIALEEQILFYWSWAISYSMVWRHPDVAIDDPRPTAGSFSMADVRRLSAHVIKLRDMPEGVIVLSGLIIGIHDFLCLPEWTGSEVQEEPSHDIRPTLQRLPFYCTPPATADTVILDPTLKDLAIRTPSSKILAKAKDSQKRKASTSSATSSHGGSFAAPATKGSNGQDSQGKGIMVNHAAASSVGASRPTPSSGPTPSFRDVSRDAIHADFFPFSAGPYYATYPKCSVVRNYEFTREEWDAPYWPTFGVLTKEVFNDPVVCKTMVDQFPIPGEMVRFESLSGDQLTAKKSVLHCLMLSHGGELLARYHGLNQSHHEYVLSEDSKMKGYEEKSKAKGKYRKKKIKSLTKSLDNLHTEVARLSAALNQATVLEAEKDEEILCLAEFKDRLAEASPLVAQTDYAFLNKISDHAAKPLSVILQLKPEKLARPTNVPPLRDARVSPPTIKESTVTPASKSLELSTNVDLTASAVAFEHNEEMVNAEVDGSNPKMTDDTVAAKSEHAFVQGISVALEDVVELLKVGSWRASSSPNDVVVALSVGEKGDGLVPSSVAGEEAAANSSGV